MIVSPVAGRENRKSDWPWRKRAEQKPHAEFSVGRSSIIGARYRPVTRQARQAGTPAQCVRLSLTLHYCAGTMPESGFSPSGISPRGHVVNFVHRRRHLYAGSSGIEIAVDTRTEPAIMHH